MGCTRDPWNKTNALSAAFLGSLGGGKSFSANLITYLSVLSGGKALVIDPKGERGNWQHDLYELGEQVNIISLSTKAENKGRLDPFSIHDDLKEAETLALDILTFLTGVRLDDSERFPKTSKAVHEVSEEDKPCLSKVVEKLLNSEDKAAKLLGTIFNLLVSYLLHNCYSVMERMIQRLVLKQL